MKNIFSLRKKTVVITGGAGYLGSAIVKGLLDFDATVVIADISKVDPKQIIKNKRYHENLHSISCDISSTDSIRDMFKKAKEICGKIDVLVNCGVYGAGYGELSQISNMTDDIWQKGLDGAVGTVFRCTREVISYMEENKGGSIVNFGSMYGLVSPDFRVYGDDLGKNPPNYGAGKAAVIQFTKYSAAQLAEKGIRVNCICPGPFPAPGNQGNKEFIKNLADKTMLGRIGKADEIAGAVIFLASDASSYMTGSNITVDGGWTAW